MDKPDKKPDTSKDRGVGDRGSRGVGDRGSRGVGDRGSRGGESAERMRCQPDVLRFVAIAHRGNG